MQLVADSTGRPDFQQRIIAINQCNPYHLHLRLFQDSSPELAIIFNMKILMVCLGNICRSPLAEGIMQQKAKQAGLPWTVDSAGTGSWHSGEPPHRLSQKVSKARGVDISGQKARQFRPADMLEFDIVFFMDEDNLLDARRMAGNMWVDAKASLLLDELYPGESRSVPDPYYGDEPDYHDVFDMISAACDAFINRHLNEKNNQD